MSSNNDETPILRLLPHPQTQQEDEGEQEEAAALPDLPGIGELSAYLTRLQEKRTQMQAALEQVREVQRRFAELELRTTSHFKEAVRTIETFKRLTHACLDLLTKQEHEGYPLVMTWLHLHISYLLSYLEEQADEVSLHLIGFRTISTSQTSAGVRRRHYLHWLLATLVDTAEKAIEILTALNHDAYTEYQNCYHRMQQRKRDTSQKEGGQE